MQIKEEGIEIQASLIHGDGVYALRRFRRGSYIGTFRGVQTKRDGIYVLWIIDEDGSQIGILGKNELRFLNHDSDPNAEFVGLDLYAVSNIQPGREIMIDYGEDWLD
jgi:hypothetical protein